MWSVSLMRFCEYKLAIEVIVVTVSEKNDPHIPVNLYLVLAVLKSVFDLIKPYWRSLKARKVAYDWLKNGNFPYEICPNRTSWQVCWQNNYCVQIFCTFLGTKKRSVWSQKNKKIVCWFVGYRVLRRAHDKWCHWCFVCWQQGPFYQKQTHMIWKYRGLSCHWKW